MAGMPTYLSRYIRPTPTIRRILQTMEPTRSMVPRPRLRLHRSNARAPLPLPPDDGSYVREPVSHANHNCLQAGPPQLLPYTSNPAPCWALVPVHPLPSHLPPVKKFLRWWGSCHERNHMARRIREVRRLRDSSPNEFDHFFQVYRLRALKLQADFCLPPNVNNRHQYE